MTVPAGATKTLWVAVAGSDKGLADAQSELAGALQDPAGALAAKVASRDKLSKWSQVSLPGDRLLQNAIDWGKQNLADITQTASDLQIRWTNQGKQFPAPLGTVAHARWFGAGYPDYPWIFATDGEYTNFAAVALGQFDVAKDHLRALRDISDVLNNRSGIVVHEAVSDGSIWFGHDSQTTAADGTKTNDFNSDETVKFPSAVALIWRWTGDNRFRDEMYDFAKRNLQVVDQRLDVDHDGWPEGSGNVERTGMGPEKLDNGVYYIRSLYDLADMARSKHDARHLRRGRRTSRASSSASSRARGGTRAAQQYADSLDRPGQRPELPEALDRPGADGGRAATAATRRTPGVASNEHGTTALAGRENSCFSGDRPGQPRPLPHRLRRRPGRQGRLRDLLADDLDPGRGEGNFGRLGPGQQQRYTHANAETMFSEPATGNTPDEQPGAMPEIFPSAPTAISARASRRTSTAAGRAGRWSCRPGATTAPRGRWSTSSSACAPTSTTACCRSCRRCRPASPAWRGRTSGSGAARSASSPRTRSAGYTTKVDATQHAGARARRSATRCRAASRPRDVRLDGQRVKHYDARETNRGLEVTVAARPGRAAHPDHHDPLGAIDAGPPPGGPSRDAPAERVRIGDRARRRCGRRTSEPSTTCRPCSRSPPCRCSAARPRRRPARRRPARGPAGSSPTPASPRTPGRRARSGRRRDPRRTRSRRACRADRGRRSRSSPGRTGPPR